MLTIYYFLCPDCNGEHTLHASSKVAGNTEFRENAVKHCVDHLTFFSGEPVAAAQAVPDCIHSPYGCCWDFTAAMGPDGEGCRGNNKSCTLDYNHFKPTLSQLLMLKVN